MAHPEHIQNQNETRREAAHSIHDGARKRFELASEWTQENYGKTLGILGVIALAGVLGYFVGKNAIQNEFQLPTPRG